MKSCSSKAPTHKSHHIKVWQGIPCSRIQGSARTVQLLLISSHVTELNLVGGQMVVEQNAFWLGATNCPPKQLFGRPPS